jgi:hypothetical protein
MGEHVPHIGTQGLHMGAHMPHVDWIFFNLFLASSLMGLNKNEIPHYFQFVQHQFWVCIFVMILSYFCHLFIIKSFCIHIVHTSCFCFDF